VEVVYHPLVKEDVIEALKYYAEISPRLADEFEYEVRLIVSQAASNPLRFHPAEQGFSASKLEAISLSRPLRSA
jgi:hypothetical protein